MQRQVLFHAEQFLDTCKLYLAYKSHFTFVIDIALAGLARAAIHVVGLLEDLDRFNGSRHRQACAPVRCWTELKHLYSDDVLVERRSLYQFPLILAHYPQVQPSILFI